MNYISYLNILDKINIQKGNVILVSSDIVKLLMVCRENNENFDGNKFIDTIINKIGDKGTLLFPTYNFGFCIGETFDYHNTLSRTGSLSNIALKRADFIRTKHPIYSHAVYGYDSELLYNINNKSAFGTNSVFEYLHKKRAKQLFIGSDEVFWYTRGYTSIHHIEQKVGVDYRYIKNFTALYINENGSKKKLTYSMYVRDLDCKDSHGNELVSQVNPAINNLLKEKDHYVKYNINGVYFGLIDMNGLGKILENDIRTKGGLVHLIPKKYISTIG